MLLKKLILDPTNPMHDFRNYAYYTFTEVLGLPAPDPLQYDIADYMQELEPSADGKVRKQIQAMRGCGKSVEAAIFCTFCWYVNPTIRILYLGSNQDLVDLAANLVKAILNDSPLLGHLRPSEGEKFTMHHGKKRKLMKNEVDQANQFNVANAGPGRDPSFVARPVFGGWTGRHPDLIIPDDCEIPENSLTELKRKRLMGKLLECESLVLEHGMIMYMGTPQTEDSIYMKLHDQGYTIRRWPAELPDPDDERSAANVSPWLINRVREGEQPGDPSYPERFGVAVLLEKQAKSLAYYNLQMLLNPNLMDDERYPLKLRNAIVLDVPSDCAPGNVVWGTQNLRPDIEHGGRGKDCWAGPAWVSEEYLPYTDKLLYVDPKGGGADSVGYVVLAHLNGMAFILEVGGLAPGQDGTSEAVMKKLATVAAQHGIKRVVVESNFGGAGKNISTYAKLLAPVMARWNGPTQIDTRYVQGQKEVRILDCLEPVFNHHRIIFCERAAKCVELSGQIGKITRDRGSLLHDDIIDALYGAVDDISQVLNLDPEVREEDERNRQALAVSKEFDEWAKNNTPYSKPTVNKIPQAQRLRQRLLRQKPRSSSGRWGRV